MLDRWQAAPATIRAWVVLNVVLTVVVALPGLPDFGSSWIVWLLWLTLWSVLLLNGSRVAWWIAVVWSGFGVAVLVLGAPADDAPSLSLVVFGLLLAATFVVLLMPSARRWVRPPSERRAPRPH